MARRVLSALLLLGTAQLLVAAKLPSFVPTCKRNAPDFDQCIRNAVEAMRPYMSSGIASLNIPPMEPLVIPALEVNRNTNDLKLRAKMRDIRAFGGSDFVVNHLKVDPDKLTVNTSITIPRLRVSADSDLDGRILGINLKTKGLFTGNLTNVKVDLKATGSVLRNKTGVEFLQAKDLHLKLKMENQKINFVSKGGRDSEASVRAAMEFYRHNRENMDREVIIPIAEEVAVAFVRQFVNNILMTVPWAEIEERI